MSDFEVEYLFNRTKPLLQRPPWIASFLADWRPHACRTSMKSALLTWKRWHQCWKHHMALEHTVIQQKWNWKKLKSLIMPDDDAAKIWDYYFHSVQISLPSCCFGLTRSLTDFVFSNLLSSGQQMFKYVQTHLFFTSSSQLTSSAETFRRTSSFKSS